jgi:hypothetical protein
MSMDEQTRRPHAPILLRDEAVEARRRRCAKLAAEADALFDAQKKAEEAITLAELHEQQ